MPGSPPTSPLLSVLVHDTHDKSDARRAPFRASSASATAARNRLFALLGAGALAGFFILYVLVPTPSSSRDLFSRPRVAEGFKSPLQRAAERTRPRTTPGVAELLRPGAPSASLYDSLLPGARYLMVDSWSGMSGQFSGALSVLHLASKTQRIAILPSWNDELHYGDSIIRMSLLFDLEGLRNATGLLFVELEDAKQQDREKALTETEEIGVFRASPWFDTPLAYSNHNLEQRLFTVPIPSSQPWTYEAFTLFDFDASTRLAQAAEQAAEQGLELPRNMREEALDPQGGSLLCYTNLWDMGHAGGGVKRVKQEWRFGNSGFQPAAPSRMTKWLSEESAGVHPEWWSVGRYLDFSPAIWKIALSSVYETLKTEDLPPLVTVHLRRGDFLTWCPTGQSCTPPASAYETAVAPLLAQLQRSNGASTPAPRVLVTTDETTDLDFLASVEAFGWTIVNHALLGTEEKLRKEFGEAWKWADAAVDQAILSLGSHFVGTRGSQVTQLSALRVESWNGGQTAIVDKVA